MKNLVHTFRVSLVKGLKLLLTRIHFKGKGSLLLALCPKNGEIIISLFGYNFNCDLSEHIQRNIFSLDYDREAQSFIKKKLKTGDTFFDIGANVGFYSLLASSIVGDKGRVIAIEPNPKVYSRLEKTIKDNNIKNILLLKIAVGKEPGFLDLYWDPNGTNDTASMLAKYLPDSINVEVIPLDTIASVHNVDIINYLKVDVDGFEPDVLSGAKTLLAEKRIEAIQSEFCDFFLQENQSSPGLLHTMLTQAGYEDVGGIPEFTKDCLLDRYFVKS